jgi:hypothetical protein
LDARVTPAAGGTFIKFDAPGAGTIAFLGTQALAMNNQGAITGWYQDNFFATHSYVRGRSGTITTFDDPQEGQFPIQGTFAFSINPNGAIAGYYTTGNPSVAQGFLRARDGTFTNIILPQAGTSAGGQGTYVANINAEGTTAGSYTDGNNVNHGFVRSIQGKVTTFDAPGAGSGFLQGTSTCLATCLNESATATGIYVDASGVNHGFVRDRNGTLTEFDVVGAGTGAGQGTLVASINSSGEIAVLYMDGGGVSHGAVRSPDGTITKFDVPGSQGTFVSTNNAAGFIVGSFADASGFHGFVRAPHGTITKFDVPGAQSTSANTINDAGVIAGTWADQAGVNHGFVWIR